MLTPEELQAMAYGIAKISTLCGAMGAVVVQLLLVAIRAFSDWFVERERVARRIAAARGRAGAASAPASEEAQGGWAGACDRQADQSALSAASPTA